MKPSTKIILTIGILALYIFSMIALASAVTISSVSQTEFYPGQSTEVQIVIKNVLSYDIEEVSLVLNLDNTEFATIGSSEDSQESINEDDKESFNFVLKSSPSTKPGNYNIPYTIVYLDDNETKQTKIGSFGITLKAKTEINYGIEAENNIIGSQGKLSLKIVNSGLGDVGFVNVKIVSANGFEVLGSNEDYIGTVSSDDFESASFDVLYKSASASLTALISYKDFDNNPQQESISLPVNVYTQEKALELGLISKSKTWIYVVLVFFVILWLVYRSWRKKRRLKKSREENLRVGK